MEGKGRRGKLSASLSPRINLGRQNSFGRPQYSPKASTGKRSNASKLEILAKLQDEAQEFERKIAHERQQAEKLEKEVLHHREEIKRYNQNKSATKWRESSSSTSLLQYRMLENRLAKGVIRCSEVNQHNRELRSRIDFFRHEKENFDNIYRKIRRDLHKKQALLARLVNASSKEQCEKEAFQKESESLTEQIRRERDAFTKKREELRRFISGGDQKPVKAVSVPTPQGKLDTYEDAFQHIRRKTGMSDIHKLVQSFVACEDKYFKLQELRMKIDTMTKSLNEKKVMTSKYEDTAVSGVAKHKAIIEGLDDKLKKAKNLSESYATQYSQAVEVVDSLKHGIQDIFDALGCKTDGLSSVTETNLMRFLEAIEERTNELLEENGGEDDIGKLVEEKREDIEVRMSMKMESRFRKNRIEEAAGSGDDDIVMPMSVEEMRKKMLAQMKM